MLVSIDGHIELTFLWTGHLCFSEEHSFDHSRSFRFSRFHSEFNLTADDLSGFTIMCENITHKLVEISSWIDNLMIRLSQKVSSCSGELYANERAFFLRFITTNEWTNRFRLSCQHRVLKRICRKRWFCIQLKIHTQRCIPLKLILSPGLAENTQY